jgi:EpsI family protein
MPADKRTTAILLAVFFGGQLLLVRTIAQSVVPPRIRPLDEIRGELGPWRLLADNRVSESLAAVLQADDLLSRTYRNQNSVAEVFVAYFKSQGGGRQPHSPKVCLPGHGWNPVFTRTVEISSAAGTLSANRLLVTNGTEKMAILYWYQTPYRTVANEFAAKFYLGVDLLRYKRSDVVLASVSVPVWNVREDEALASATEMARVWAPAIQKHCFSQADTELGFCARMRRKTR